jgi:hypothetical protein
MNINDILSDEEIEDCLEGTSDIKWIRGLINLSQIDNLIDEEGFADMFSFELRKFIDVPENSEEYDDAYENNWVWGYSIAENINELVMNKFTK